MRFWETSALIPLCVEEPGSAQAKALLEADPDVAVWWGTPVEQASGLARRVRDGTMSAEDEAEARTVLDRMAATWLVVTPSTPVLDRAVRLVRTHPLRAADALHLAAALTWSGQSPAGRVFVTLDQRLRDAALREGFRVVPERI
ncbi:MAG TPA: type II toxin-antitoxin system VapC family toxin [Gemmatimonadales bacterium]|nr:type II toxin-antitoxin system VapC family toxin [Gemmatimonadales bacterium]